MSYMLSDCSKLTELNLSSFDTKNVIDMSCMFYNCPNLQNLNVLSFDVETPGSSYIISGNKAKKDLVIPLPLSLPFGLISPIENKRNIDTSDMLSNCFKLKTVKIKKNLNKRIIDEFLTDKCLKIIEK